MILILINLQVDFSGFCEPVDDTVIKYSKSLKFYVKEHYSEIFPQFLVVLLC